MPKVVHTQLEYAYTLTHPGVFTAQKVVLQGMPALCINALVRVNDVLPTVKVQFGCLVAQRCLPNPRRYPVVARHSGTVWFVEPWPLAGVPVGTGFILTNVPDTLLG